VTWTVRGPRHRSYWLYRVTWSGTQFVAVGHSSPTSTLILTSPDGVTWTTQASELRVPCLASPGRGRSSCSGKSRDHPHLSDGVTWTAQASELRMRCIASPGRARSSCSGKSRDHPHLSGRGDVDGADSGTTAQLNSVTWTGTQFFAFGSQGTILTSPDGVTWTTQTSGVFVTCTELPSLETSSCRGSDGGIFTSPMGDLDARTLRDWPVFNLSSEVRSVTWSGHSLSQWERQASPRPHPPLSGAGNVDDLRTTHSCKASPGRARSSWQWDGVLFFRHHLTSPDGVTWTARPRISFWALPGPGPSLSQ